MRPGQDMETITSFAQRRPAAGSLPAFSLPPPNAEIPRTADGLSPSLSSVHTAGSQASQHHQNMNSYTFSGGSMPNSSSNPASGASGASWSGSWTNSNSNYPQGQQALPTSPYSRHSISSAGNPANDNAMSFSNPRTTQSPVTGPDGLSASPYDQSQQHYVAHGGHSMATAAPQHPGLMATSSQPPAQSPLSAHSDAYTHAYAPTHTRPGSNPSYYASSGHSQFSSYAPPQHSPTQPSPTTGSPGARGISSLPNNLNYRYSAYGQSLPVMSNMHHPGGQMSMIPGMSQHQGYGSQMVYPHHPAPPQPRSERPFRCDQCVQSFSRNHDLKRHKRIHLPIKPFPCNYCSKSFSRKDALKRHRLVKGCETRSQQNSEQNDESRRPGDRPRE